MPRFAYRLPCALLNRLASCRDGAVLMEFGLVAPTFFLLLMGLFDLGQLGYANAVLGGAVQEAARSAALETGDTDEADAMVRSIMGKILPGAVVTTSRVSYFDFADIGRAEAWNDENADGECNDDENYTDENDNGEWDEDIGEDGNGGAGDVVMYSVDVTYTSLFAMPLLPSSMGERSLSASAIKKNQPFAAQEGLGGTVGNCE